MASIGEVFFLFSFLRWELAELTINTYIKLGFRIQDGKIFFGQTKKDGKIFKIQILTYQNNHVIYVTSEFRLFIDKLGAD